jgi:C4-dicarboxylate-specific signal transduction histidine kinase
VNNPGGNQNKSALRAATRTFLFIMTILFVCESAVMALLHLLGLRGPADILLDPILLSILGVLPLYYMLFRPLRKALEQRQQAEQNLRARNRQIITVSKALQRTQEQLAQKYKMAAVGTIAAGVAHEVGNPLACLSAIAQTLNKHILSQEEHKYLASHQEHVQRITKIIRELEDFAKPSTDKPSPVDLAALVEDTVRMVRYSGRCPDARMEIASNGEIPRICIPVQSLQLVLVNLLFNALDAVKDLEGQPVITIERTVEEDWIRIKVTDQGVGMTKEQVKQACDPFYTTKSPGEGTGLGLAVTYRILEQLNGRMNIDSSPGRGTVVTVSLPLTDVAELRPNHVYTARMGSGNVNNGEQRAPGVVVGRAGTLGIS